MSIAFFDFDGTLIVRDSGVLCAIPSIRRGLVGPRLGGRLVGTYLLSKAGLRTRTDAQRVGFECYRGRSLDELRAIPQTDLVVRQRHSLELWRRLVVASDNIAYQLAFNSMEQAWSNVGDLIAPALRDELEDQRGYDRMVRAVQRGDAAGARRAAQHLVARGEAGLLRILGLASRAFPAKGTR